MMGLDPITIAIIAINVLFSMKGFTDFSFKSKYLFNVGAIRRGEQVRMVSSAFLHADFHHLFVNMLTLYFFANTVIVELGVFPFVVVYVGSLILGNLLSYYFHKDDYHYTALGASGAVSGVLYAAILLKPMMTLGLCFLIPIKAYVFGIGYLLYSIYGIRAQNDNIGHDAHFGGAAGGYLITLFLMPSLVQEHTSMVVLLVIPIIILFILIKLGKI